MAKGFQHAASLSQRDGGVLEMLEHPQADDEVKRPIRKGKVLADAPDHRHRRGAMLAQRGRVRIQPGGKPDVAPEQLHHTAPAATEVEHRAACRDVAAHDRLELVTARSPAGPDGAIALAERVLNS